MYSARTWFTAAAVALGTIAMSAPAVSHTPNGLPESGPAKVIKTQLAAAVCMTDDGYGRKRPCSGSDKRANPGWRGTANCMTNDGDGRFRPCSAYEKKHQH